MTFSHIYGDKKKRMTFILLNFTYNFWLNKSLIAVKHLDLDNRIWMGFIFRVWNFNNTTVMRRNAVDQITSVNFSACIRSQMGRKFHWTMVIYVALLCIHTHSSLDFLKMKLYAIKTYMYDLIHIKAFECKKKKKNESHGKP